MALRWEEREGMYIGFAGNIIVAMVCRWNVKQSSQWIWELCGVTRVHGWKHRGYRKDRAGGQRAAEVAWARWCKSTGLQQIPFSD